MRGARWWWWFTFFRMTGNGRGRAALKALAMMTGRKVRPNPKFWF